MAQLLPVISGTVARWTLQGALTDDSGNGLDFSMFFGTETYTTLDGTLQGFDFNTTRTLHAPSSSLLRIGGEITIQFLMKLRGINVATWFLCYPYPTVAQLYHWYTAISNDIGYADVNHGTSSGGNLTPPDYSVANIENQVHLVTLRRQDIGGGNFRVETFIGGGKVGGHLDVTAITPGGTETLFVGGYSGSPELNAVMAGIRILNFARSDADILADTEFAEGSSLTVGAELDVYPGATMESDVGAELDSSAASVAPLAVGAELDALVENIAILTVGAELDASVLVVGDFEDVPCICASTPILTTGTAGPSVVGEFEVACDCIAGMDVEIISPAAGPIGAATPLVWTVTSSSSIAGTTGTVTDSSGTAVVAFSTSDGFINGFTGSVVGITEGVEVTIIPPAAWLPGPLHLHVDAADEGGGTGSADRDFYSTPPGVLMDQARSRVIVQYRNSPRLLKWVDALVSYVQNLWDLAQTIPPRMDYTTAVGLDLVKIGELVGQTKQFGNGDTATDAEFRVLIGARITRNNTRVSSADYLAYLVAFFNAQIVLVDLGGMAISYTVMRAPTADEIAVLNGDIVARPMGVKVTRSFVTTIPYFGFQGDPNARGFSDHTGTPGAPFAQRF